MSTRLKKGQNLALRIVTDIPDPKFAFAWYVRNGENERIDYHSRQAGEGFEILLRGKIPPVGKESRVQA